MKTFPYRNYFINIEDKPYEDACRGQRIEVKTFENQREMASCIVSSELFSVSNEDSFLIDENRLLLCCGNLLYCLSLPKLEIIWKTITDDVVNFKIYKLEDGYLTHGEICITKIDFQGNKVWEFSGADIWVSVDKGEKEVILEKEHILLRDFNGGKYIIDYNGKRIWDSITSQKPWWKF